MTSLEELFPEYNMVPAPENILAANHYAYPEPTTFQNSYRVSINGVELQEAQPINETQPALQSNPQSHHLHYPQQQVAIPTNSPGTNARQPTPSKSKKSGKSQSSNSSKPQGVRKARTLLSADDKKYNHKEAEARRRNRRAEALERFKQFVPESFKDGTTKQNSEAKIFDSGANWLEWIKKDNDRLQDRIDRRLAELRNARPQGYPQRAPVAVMPI